MSKRANGTCMQVLGDDLRIFVLSQAVQQTNLSQLDTTGALNEAFGTVHPFVGIFG